VRRIAGDRPVFRFDEGEMEGENGGENGGENRGQEGKFSRCVDSLLDFMDLNWRKGRHSSKKTSKKPSSESGAG
ncbi:MAG: hypothetical protein QOJ27_1322, partial [Sphingomonadales bacterium]|nr:hypothetical protein [Sphingomonadales bacterium]